MESSETYAHVNIFLFLFYLIWYRSFHTTVEKLNKAYNSKNLILDMFWKKLYILQTKNLSKTILSSHAVSQLTYVNDAFSASHGHQYGIGNLNFQNKDCLWNDVHYALRISVDVHHMERLLTDNIHILTDQNTYLIDEKVKELLIIVWARFSFGDTVDIEKFKTMRNLLINTLQNVFHKNWTNYIPYLSLWVCKYKRSKHQKDLNIIDAMLKDLIQRNSGGFIHKFANNMNDIKNPCVQNNLDQIILDNAFLSVLVFDFIYILMVNTLTHVAKYKIDEYEQRIEKKKEFIKGSFLYPFRFRQIGNDVGIFKKGDYVLMNFIEADILFSSGPRICIGVGFVDRFYRLFFKLLKKYEFRLTCPNKKIEYSNNKNIPIITSKHEVTLIEVV